MLDQTLANDDMVTRVYAEEVITSFRQQMQETERLAEELHDILKTYEATLEQKGIHDQTATLIGWAECYRHGLQAADKIFQSGNSWLSELETRLKKDEKLLKSIHKAPSAMRRSFEESLRIEAMAS